MQCPLPSGYSFHIFFSVYKINGFQFEVFHIKFNLHLQNTNGYTFFLQKVTIKKSTKSKFLWKRWNLTFGWLEDHYHVPNIPGLSLTSQLLTHISKRFLKLLFHSNLKMRKKTYDHFPHILVVSEVTGYSPFLPTRAGSSLQPEL